MLTLLHLSDLHFGPPFASQVGEAALRAARRAEPDVIVVSGDFTQRAKRQQFEQARQFLEQLPDVPKVVVPGNHDVPLFRVLERLRNPLGLYRQYISDRLDRIWQFDGAVIVGLNSSAPRRSISNGRLDQHQLDFCQQAFQNAPSDAARIVVAHHHLIPAPDYVHDQTMPGSKRAINRFVELGVDLILGGHLHRAYIGNSLDVFSGTHRERGIIIVQCGTTTSRRGRGREREKNSLNLIKVGGQMLRVTHYMYFEQLCEFSPISRHLFPLPGHDFVEGHLHEAD